METSDSEYFESADDEVYSDNEKSSSEINSKAATRNEDNEFVNIKNLNISVDEIQKSSSEQHSFESTDKLTVGPLSKTTNETKTKGTSKLGSKLGSKISDCNFVKNEMLDIKVSQGNSLAVNSYEPTNSNKTDLKSKSNEKLKQSQVKEISSITEKQLDTGNVDTTREISAKNLNSEDNKNLDEKEINMWEDDLDWEPVANKPIEGIKEPSSSAQVQSNSNWGWGNWDVSSLLSTATVGVTTITNHVSQGLTSVLESGIGVPQPEELARLHKEQEERVKDIQEESKEDETPNIKFGLGNWVSGVTQITKFVETTGTKVITGGLDTLETIGKKTMEVLQEGDPGLKKKRAFLKLEPDKPVLSYILREAKEKAETENKALEEMRVSKKANYELLFDDHQGLVHLEALEMLSKQCDIKLQSLLESKSGSELMELQETMTQIAELCELMEEEEEEEFNIQEIKENLNSAVSEMNITISCDKLIASWLEAEEWLSNLNLNVCNEIELHEQAIEILAHLTAIAMEQYHKIAELMLIKDHRSTADEADSLVQ